jgi:glycosyltransferase involved in cell wall biosynthesis
MNDFYNSGDVLYFPSKSEGFEMVTLESLAAGVPVVGNRVGAVLELSEREFPGVHLLKKDTIEIVLEQLRAVAGEYKGNMDKREALHEKIKEQFGLENYSRKIMREIEDSFGEKRKKRM